MSNLKAYKYRLYPTTKQAARLQEVLDRNRELYNAALQERREAYRIGKVSLGYNQQAAQLPEIKEIRPEYADIHSQVLQDTLRRVDKAFKAFFRRIKNAEKPGDPRFQASGRYDSFTYVRHEVAPIERQAAYTASPGQCPRPVPNLSMRCW
jgi:putative transposase